MVRAVVVPAGRETDAAGAEARVVAVGAHRYRQRWCAGPAPGAAVELTTGDGEALTTLLALLTGAPEMPG